MCDENNSHALTLKYLLTTAFLSGLPTSRQIWVQIEKLFINLVETFGSEGVDDIVLDSTFNHKLSYRYPRNCVYSNNVKSWLKEIWGKYQWPSKILCRNTNVDADGITESDLGYKTYFLEYDYHYITLLESFEGITKGTTGLSSWGASRVLYSWCLENSSVINNKKVIELGSGIGYTAASILSSFHPSSYTATDYHPTVLSILQHNLSLQCSSTCKTREELLKFCSETKIKMEEEELAPGEFEFWVEGNEYLNEAGGTAVTVKQLDWRRPLPSGLLPAYDVIMAADVVYALHLIPDLVHIIRILLSANSDKEREEKVVKNAIRTRKKKEIMLGSAIKSDNKTRAYSGINTNINRMETKELNEKFNDKLLFETTNKLNKDINKEENDVMDKEEQEILTEECPQFEFPVAFIACTRRDPDTIAAFLHQIAEQRLKVKKIFQTTLDNDEALFSYNESYKPISIFQISL